jgi:phosphate:Na+ symporter
MFEALGLVIGLGIFLLGMSLLESGIRELGAGHLKYQFNRYTRTPLGSVGFGIVSTAILQSSSMVSLLVLAFASANVLPLYNAIGIILGANLGTTLTGWIVATIGFKLELQSIALPLIAVAGLSQVFFSGSKKQKIFSLLTMGLGLLIFGLDFMKETVSDLPAQWDITKLNDYPPIFFLAAGVLMAALIQSSSAVMVITLAALNAELISLVDAAALVMGADLGTTSTTLLGSITGGAIKKRLALSHFLFNFCTNLAAFFVLLPVLPLAVEMLSINDPLYTLVGFHSTFNLLGLLVFLPLLKKYSSWLDTTFREKEEQISAISKLSKDIPEAVLPSFTKITYDLYLQSIALNLRNLKIDTQSLSVKDELKKEIEKQRDVSQSFEESYEAIKESESELLQFFIHLQEQPLEPALAKTINDLLEIIRAIVYSCKTLKDIREDLVSLRHSESEMAVEIETRHKRFHLEFYSSLLPLLQGQHEESYLREQQEALMQLLSKHQNETNTLVYNSPLQSEPEIINSSSILNVNREIHHSAKNLIQTLSLWSFVNR